MSYIKHYQLYYIKLHIPDGTLLQKEPQNADTAPTLRRNWHPLSCGARRVRTQTGGRKSAQYHHKARGGSLQNRPSARAEEKNSGIKRERDKRSLKLVRFYLFKITLSLTYFLSLFAPTQI